MLNAGWPTPIKFRRNMYLNNVAEQDRRAAKHVVKPMMGFKNFRCVRIILSDVEIMHMIHKRKIKDDGVASTVAAKFYSLRLISK